MMQWQLYAGIGSAFLLGGVAGGLVGTAAERDRIRQAEKDGRLPALEVLVTRMAKELKLNDSQSHQLREIYNSARPELIQVEAQRRRKLKAILDQTEAPTLEILTPAQKERFQELQVQLRRRMGLDNPEAVSPGTSIPPAQNPLPNP